MATMPSLTLAGQSASAHAWFRSAPGLAVIDSQAGEVARALGARPGQHWLWLGPADGGDTPGDGRGLHLVRSDGGWRGDIACGLPLPLPNEAFATVVLQHVVPAGGASDALLAEAARILLPGGRLWMFALNPLSPYRWRWRGMGLSASEPLVWRRRLRQHGFAPDPVSQGIGPTWQIASSAGLQHGPGMRAAYLLCADKRQWPLTPQRARGELRLPRQAPAA